jgi:cyclohexa-1,5-dienecarbonyl-CoA hydratase
MSGAPGRVKVDRVGTRANVTWSRPPVNVFDIATLRELTRALRSDPVRSAHVVVLKGAGRCWSAGFAVEDHFAVHVRAMFRAFRGLLEALEGSPGPIVAQVEGTCLGGGLEVLSACDLAIAAASTRFGQPEVRLGVFPPLAAAEMPRAIGPKRAAELLLLGETIAASRAEQVGLVSRVVPDDAVEEEVNRVVGQLQKYRFETLVLLRRAIHEGSPKSTDRLGVAEQIYLDELMRLPSAEEGLRAFLEKRTPIWPASGR